MAFHLPILWWAVQNRSCLRESCFFFLISVTLRVAPFFFRDLETCFLSRRYRVACEILAIFLPFGFFFFSGLLRLLRYVNTVKIWMFFFLGL